MHSDDVLRLLDQGAEGLVVGMDAIHAAPRVGAAIGTQSAPVRFGRGRLINDHGAAPDVCRGDNKLFSGAGFRWWRSFAALREKSISIYDNGMTGCHAITDCGGRDRA